MKFEWILCQATVERITFRRESPEPAKEVVGAIIFFFVDATTQIPNTVRLRKAAKNILWGTREACIPSSHTGLIKLESEILTQFRLTKGYGF